MAGGEDVVGGGLGAAIEDDQPGHAFTGFFPHVRWASPIIEAYGTLLLLRHILYTQVRRRCALDCGKGLPSTWVLSELPL